MVFEINNITYEWFGNTYNKSWFKSEEKNIAPNLVKSIGDELFYARTHNNKEIWWTPVDKDYKKREPGTYDPHFFGDIDFDYSVREKWFLENVLRK